jgi:hypothetical protein
MLFVQGQYSVKNMSSVFAVSNLNDKYAAVIYIAAIYLASGFTEGLFP